MTKSINTYDLINGYLEKDTLLKKQYQLSWLSEYSEWERDEINERYDICLVDEQLFWLLKEKNQLSDLPLITLTQDYETGLHTIKAGATDYWNLTNLCDRAAPRRRRDREIERSLRLILNYNHRLITPNTQTNHAFYEEFLRHCVDGLFTIHILSDGTLVYGSVNSAYEKLTGIPRKDILGKKITETLLPLEERKYLDCLFSQKTVNYERTVQVKGQNNTWLIVLVPIKNRQGQVFKIQGIAKNITQEKQAIVGEIRRTRYRNILRSLVLEIRQSLDISKIIKTTVTELHKSLHTERVIIIEFEPNGLGRIIEESVTPNFPQMLKKVISKEHYNQIVSYNYERGFFDNWEDIETADISLDYREFLQQYQIRASLVIPIIRRFVIRDCQNLYANSITRLWGLLCVHQCSEPRKWTKDEIELLQQLVAQLNIALSQAELLENEVKQRQELARSNAELEQFAYVASHDLQAPLQTISNYAQLLEYRYHERLDDKADKYINYIVSAVDRMRTQINDLLEYSRVDRQQSTFGETDIRFVVEQAIANLQSEIELNQAKITCSNNLPKLIVDRSQFVTLFQNLLGNSLKYRRSIPLEIKIDVTQQNNTWQFSVRDNGIGIEEQHQKRIFQIFQRLHTQDEYPGTGIGLAICQKIVQRHGGNIWVKSQIARGTTFYFTIPKQIP